MPHGLPDDANIVKPKWSYNLDDMAELAVRVGGSKLLDRLGDIVYVQTFSHGLKNIGSGGLGVGHFEGLTGQTSIHEGVAYKLLAPAGGGNYSGFWVSIYRPLSAQTGYEFAFVVEEDLNQFFFMVDDWRVADHAQCYIRWDRTAGGWSVFDNTLGLVLFHAQADLYTTGYTWWRLKLVMDLDAPSYRYIKINDEVFDLSAYTPNMIGAGPAVYQEISWLLYPDATHDSIMMLDDINITQNEPIP